MSWEIQNNINAKWRAIKDIQDLLCIIRLALVNQLQMHTTV